MNAQCPRCLSTMFPKVNRPGSLKIDACTFCVDMDVHKSGGGFTTQVRCEPKKEVSNVVPLRGSHATRAME